MARRGGRPFGLRGCGARTALFALLGACSLESAGSLVQEPGGSGGEVADAADLDGPGGSGGSGMPDAAGDGASGDASSGADSGDVSVDTPVDVADAVEEEACTPATCAALGHACGTWPDPCAGVVDCGTCSNGACHDGDCAEVVFVKADAVGAGNGTSWVDAFPSVQQAVSAASAGAEVWVAGGKYDAHGAAAVLTMQPGNVFYGGFAGSETDFTQRDLGAGHVSLLDGGGAVRVVVGASDARLDGFTLAKGNSGGGHGAGLMLSASTSFVLSGCRLEANQAGGFGGGAYLETGSSATLLDCTFDSNTASHGAGIFSDHASLVIDRTVFRSNHVYGGTGGGGAIDNHYSPATIRNSVFVDNTAAPYFGGAIYNLGTEAHVVIQHCTFFRNVAGTNGGAIFNNTGAWNEIANSILWGNAPEEIYDWSGAGTTTIRYSDVAAWPSSQPGMLSVDPRFVDESAGDVRLEDGSPCIDAADGALSTPTDALDQPRHDVPGVTNTGIGAPSYADLGAYENQGP